MIRFLTGFLCLLSTVEFGYSQRGPVPGLDTTTPYLIYYGSWSTPQVEFARLNYRLVILHPVSNITAMDIATIQKGADNVADTADDVPVLAYISVGEDDRPAAPVVGDGSGPRVDPRSSDTEPLAGIDPLGLVSPSGTGFASYYLDDTVPDGQPDTNSIFGGPFVNAGDPAWYQVLRNNLKNVDGVSGFQEILTDTVGIGFACDGVFLDTLDTPAPNSFGATFFEWTTPGFQSLLAQISADYPDKLILGNRGIFFYNPNLKQYEFSIRPYLNLILFESYYTDSSDANTISPFFDDNKYNWAPKLNAEAGRADGFTILGLGYDHPASIPQSVKDQDYIETMKEQGWPLYRTNGALNTPFQTEASDWVALNPDTAAPVWDSTASTSNIPPPPRVGVQEVIALDGGAIVRWDVARDQTGPVKYHVYVTDGASMNFATAVKMADVTADIPVAYASGTGAGVYAHEVTLTGLTNGTPYLFAVRAEDRATPAHEDANTVVIGATPSNGGATFATMTIDGDFSDWAGIAPLFADGDEGTVVDFLDVWVANDADFLYVRFTLETAASPYSDFNTHVFIDGDDDSGTGFVPPGSSFGSELMIELGTGYDQRGGGFNEGTASATNWALSPAGPGLEFEFRVSLNMIYADSQPVIPGQSLRLLLQDNRGDEITGIDGIPYTLATPPPADPPTFASITIDGDLSDWATVPVRRSLPSTGKAIDFKDVYVANDGGYLFGRFTLHSPAAAFADLNSHVFIDTDGSSATGFVPTGSAFGSEFFVEQGTGYDQRNGSFTEGVVSGVNWAIAPGGVAQDFEFRISRAALYADSSPVFGSLMEGLQLLIQDNRLDSLAGVPFGFAPANSLYEIWRAEKFTTAQLADESISGDDADPDVDGIPNLLEFAFFRDPLLSDAHNLTQAIEVNGHPGIRYVRRQNSGLGFVVEQSADLETWDDDPANFNDAVAMDLGNGTERVDVVSMTPIDGTNHGFLRVRVND